MKSILFQSQWIPHIANGTKTVTRRTMKPQPPFISLPVDFVEEFSILGRDYRARYRVGEVVYIKEAHYLYGYWVEVEDSVEFREVLRPHCTRVFYPDTIHPDLTILKGRSEHEGWYSRTPMFLPADCARYFIKITSVRAERLQEITLEDIYDEGIDIVPSYDRIDAFKKLWNSINKSYPWESNPFVWVYEFELVDNPSKEN